MNHHNPLSAYANSAAAKNPANKHLFSNETGKVSGEGEKVATIERKTIKQGYSEDDLQRACVKWVQLYHPQLWEAKRLFHIPNGGKRDAREAAKFKELGVQAGVSDLLLTIPRGKWNGMFIELKVGNNGLSQHQKVFIAAHEKDYYTAIVRSLDEFIREIENYLKCGATS